MAIKSHRTDFEKARLHYTRSKWCATATIAGCAAIMLTLLVTASPLHPQSFYALFSLFVLVTVGAVVFELLGEKWSGKWNVNPGRMGLFAIATVLLVIAGLVSPPRDTIDPFTQRWWFTIIAALGLLWMSCHLRYYAEREVDRCDREDLRQ
jgi:hypothetical protein